MEEPEATMRSQQKSMALFSGFNVVKKMADTIQPDRYIDRQIVTVRQIDKARQIDRKIEGLNRRVWHYSVVSMLLKRWLIQFSLTGTYIDRQSQLDRQIQPGRQIERQKVSTEELFSGFNVVKKMADTIQPDRYIHRQIVSDSWVARQIASWIEKKMHRSSKEKLLSYKRSFFIQIFILKQNLRSCCSINVFFLMFSSKNKKIIIFSFAGKGTCGVN